MPIVVKAIDMIAKKWATRAGAAQGDYATGLTMPRQDWATATEAAEGSYNAGIAAAQGRHGFLKGVAAAGTAKWQRKATTLGPARYTSGVSAAQPDYATKFGPYRDVISNLNLNPRGPRGDPGNAGRSAAVGAALHQKKVSG